MVIYIGKNIWIFNKLYLY